MGSHLFGMLGVRKFRQIGILGLKWEDSHYIPFLKSQLKQIYICLKVAKMGAIIDSRNGRSSERLAAHTQEKLTRRKYHRMTGARKILLSFELHIIYKTDITLR